MEENGVIEDDSQPVVSTTQSQNETKNAIKSKPIQKSVKNNPVKVKPKVIPFRLKQESTIIKKEPQKPLVINKSNTRIIPQKEETVIF